MDHIAAMNAALEEAQRGLDDGELPIGAVVIAGGEVVASRHTEDRGQGRRLVHADLLALQDADRLSLSIEERSQSTLVVTLEPCPMCLGAAMSFGVGVVVFALESPSDGATSMFEAWDRRADLFPGYRVPRIEAGLGRDAARVLFSEFVAKPGPRDGLWRWARHLTGVA